MQVDQVPVPPHVPSNLVRDFDFMNPDPQETDVHLAWKNVQMTHPELFWTPHYGGHWVVTRGADVVTIQNDFAHFSHRHITVPPAKNRTRLIPLEADPPESTPYRQLMNPWLSPRVVSAQEDKARKLSIELIEGFYSSGECEFVHEFSKKLPIGIFLSLVDLPWEDYEMLTEIAEMSTRPKQADGTDRAFELLGTYLMKWMAIRREKPGEDIISYVVHSKIDGEPLTPQRQLEMLILIMFGGLDTVTSMLGFVALFLARNPDHRRQLIEDPSLIPQAVNEIIRRHGIAITSRQIAVDYEFKGVQLKKGEMIQAPNLMFGLDDDQFEEPLKVDFHRQKKIHAAFGNGSHRCPGSFLARTEIKVFIEEWLKRIPDFEVKPGETVRMMSGPVSGLLYLPLSWDVKSPVAMAK